MPKNTDDSDEEFISKTEIKESMHELQSLGEQLIGFPKAKLHKLPLNDTILSAIEEARRISSREAMRRHLQYMGKLMREADHEAIRVELLQQDPNQREKAIERHLSRLLEDNDDTADIEYLLKKQPALDRQQLRHLQRSAVKEKVKQANQTGVKTPAKNKLAKYLRDVL